MRFISATQLFSGKEFLPQNSVIVLNDKGKITDITTKESIEELNIECFEGIICPGFINAHCHLELSHLKGMIPKYTGIVDFGLGVIKHRNDKSIDEQIDIMKDADREMHQNGIVAVGDICNGNTSISVKQHSSIYYHSFIELIALNPERANQVFINGLSIKHEFKNAQLTSSLAPHAPYSCSTELIKKIANDCFAANLPTTIHNQESKAENDFFISKTGDYVRLYKELSLNIDFFDATDSTSLKSVIEFFNRNINVLLVHNSFTNQDDLSFATKTHSNLFWCLCAQANEYIERTMPPINLLFQNNCKLTLGTDSLASNNQLSIIEEINLLQQTHPDVLLEDLLKAATYNGADYLKIHDKFGLITTNKTPGINLITGNKGHCKVKRLA